MLTSVLARFGATGDTLRSVYRNLEWSGAEWWVGGVYVAAAALLKPKTLAFVLPHAKTPVGLGSVWSTIPAPR